MIQDRLKELTKLTERSLANARAGRRLMAAVSGGADSVCLLLCACALREKGYALSAAHVRHDLRETAGEDEAFVRDLCGGLNVPFYAASVHVPRTGSVVIITPQSVSSIWYQSQWALSCSAQLRDGWAIFSP